MFGYVTICGERLSDTGKADFKAYYCGLCKATGKCCSQAARLGLSYDITFLAIVLSAADADNTHDEYRRCILHPRRGKMRIVCGRTLDYAARGGNILSYLKALDDVRDDKSFKSLVAAAVLYPGARSAMKRCGGLYTAIKGYLDKLSALEKENCANIDETADCFAKILETLFTPPFISDESKRRILAWLGYNIGRWIYVMDAYSDIEKDIKRGSYNTFAAAADGSDARGIKDKLRERLKESMTFTLENAASAYNLLDSDVNREVIENILYTALKNKQNVILGEEDESV